MLQIGRELIFFLKLFAKRFNHLVVCVEDVAAAPADQVDVRTVLESGVNHAPIPQVDPAGEPAGDEQVQRTVHGGDIDHIGTVAHLGEDIIGSDMAAGMGQGLDDHFPLRGDAVPALP